MLSAAARPYIDASVPVLRQHGIAITSVFYKNMFQAHPDLKNMFNMGNQANGSQQQSLASAVFAYAANIDNAAALAPVIKRIVHKHAAVGLTADHYPIVGEHLIGAIKQVLGDDSSQELLDAWGEAYWLLANQLIEAEKELYIQSDTSAGELMELVVINKQQETDQITSYYLQQTDGNTPGQFVPGQYVSVEAILNEGKQRQLRQYSLSDSTAAPWWRISVKREDDVSKPQGQVSNWIHKNIEIGSIIKVSKPFGDFTLDLESNKPIALLSAGVGITPMLSMLNTLRDTAPDRDVLFAHATQVRAHHAHIEDIITASNNMPHLLVHSYYETASKAEPILHNTGVHQGLMNINGLWESHIQAADIYLCGPIGFMRAMREDLLASGIKADRIHREVFGPDLLDHIL
ncbi:MAG: NO-inducible flavohemoprotein [Nitrosomonadales bacterium]|nr:NO-inducible flavohemoprotein [Nitrosomonadales bacterium]